MSNKIFNTFSAKETQKLAGVILAGLIKESLKDRALVLALQGDLGSGKTTFTQGLAKFLKIKGRVNSPTFVVMKRFKNFYHIDCYRLKDEKDALELDLKNIMADPKNIVAIEWPEKIKSILPKNTVFINFKFIDNKTREISFKTSV